MGSTWGHGQLMGLQKALEILGQLLPRCSRFDARGLIGSGEEKPWPLFGARRNPAAALVVFQGTRPCRPIRDVKRVRQEKP